MEVLEICGSGLWTRHVGTNNYQGNGNPLNDSCKLHHITNLMNQVIKQESLWGFMFCETPQTMNLCETQFFWFMPIPNPYITLIR